MAFLDPANPYYLLAALITISTRASLKKYHTFNLTLGMGGNGNEWEFERIGTEREKMHVEKEIHDIREKLAKVDEWKKRREDIEVELAKVWVGSSDVLNAPSYAGEKMDGESSVEVL